MRDSETKGFGVLFSGMTCRMYDLDSLRSSETSSEIGDLINFEFDEGDRRLLDVLSNLFGLLSASPSSRSSVVQSFVLFSEVVKDAIKGRCGRHN